MPPKTEITKSKLLASGLEIAREQGIEAVTARSLAQWMKCSTQPIYSAFASMEELKAAVYEKASGFATAQIQGFQDSRYIPPLCLAIGYLKLAKEEKQLFRSVYLSEFSTGSPSQKRHVGEELMSAHVPDSTRLRHADMEALKRIFFKMSVYITGLGAMVNTGVIDCTVEESAAMVSDIYETLLAGEHLEAGNTDYDSPLPLGRVIGSGANADVYEYGPDKALKLFRSKDQSGSRDYEYRNHTTIQQAGLPIPQLFQRVEINGLPGLVYEKIVGETVAERMLGAAGLNDIRLLARLLHQIHSVPVQYQNYSSLPKVKDMLHWQIEHGTGLLQAEKEAVFSILSELPDGSCLCHGDLNPLNVIIRDGKPVIIDWQGASIGHPAYDVMQLLLIWRYAVVSEDMCSKEFIAAFEERRQEFHDVFLTEYLRLTGGNAADIDSWLIPVAAAKLNDGHCEEERERLLRAIRERLAAKQAD